MSEPFDSSAFFKQFNKDYPETTLVNLGRMPIAYIKASMAHGRKVREQERQAEAIERAKNKWSWPKRMWLLFMPGALLATVKAWPDLGPFALFILAIAFFITTVVCVIHDDNKQKAANPEYVTMIELMGPIILAYVVYKSPVILLFLSAVGYLAWKAWS